MASFDANIDLEVVVRSKQLDQLEKRLEKINKFTVTGAGNKEYFDTKNAIAYNKQVDGVIEKLERIAKFSNQYSKPIGPPIDGAYIKKVDDLLVKLEKIAKIDNQFANKRVGPEQGRTQYSSPVGPNQQAPLTAAQKLTKERIAQLKLARAAGIEKQKQRILDRAELKNSQNIARINNERIKGLSQYANAIGPEINRLAQLEARAAQEKLESQRRYNILVDQTITKLERIARIEKQYQRKIGPQSANANQYSGPIGPGQASATALSSRLPPRRQPNRFFTSRGMGARGGFSGGGGLSAGIGFPLLFGSGPASILGGAGGSAFGFGGQILGSAVGGQLDQLTQKAGNFAKALRGVGSVLDALEETISGVDAQTKRYIQNLEESGQKVEAAALASEVLSQKIGVDNAEAFIRAGQAADGATDSLKNVGTILTALSERFRSAGENPTGLTPNGVLDLLPPELRPKPPTPAEDTPEFKNRTTDLQAQLRIEELLTQEKLEQAALSTRDLAVQKIIRDLDAKKLNADQASAKINIEDEKLVRKLADLEEQRADNSERRAKAQDRARQAENRELERQQRAAAQALDKARRGRAAILQETQKQAALDLKLLEQEEGRQAAISDELLGLQNAFVIQVRINELTIKDVNLRQEKLETLKLEYELRQNILNLEAASLRVQERLTALKGERALKDVSTDIGRQIEDANKRPTANTFGDEQANLRIDQVRRELDIRKDLNRQIQDQTVKIEELSKARNAAGQIIDPKAVERAVNERKNLEDQVALYNQLLPQLNAAEQAQLQYNQALQAAQPFTEAFAQGLVGGLRDVVAGTKTAEEALADLINNVADIFLQRAAEMLAQALLLKAVGLFTGGSPAGAAGGAGAGGGIGKLIGFAEGGFVTSPTTATIGEGGSDEYVIPASKMSSAMSRYSSGARGDAVINGADGSSDGGGGTAIAEAPTSVTIEGGVMQFNDTNYIRQDQVPAIITQASKQGEARALRRLQMSPGARRKAGI